MAERVFFSLKRGEGFQSSFSAAKWAGQRGRARSVLVPVEVLLTLLPLSRLFSRSPHEQLVFCIELIRSCTGRCYLCHSVVTSGTSRPVPALSGNQNASPGCFPP